MRLWRRTREELSGAWRSLRYDLGRRRGSGGSAPYAAGTVTGPTGDGGGFHRRVAAASVFGVLAVVGAAGSYLAVIGGLGPLLTESVVAQRLPVSPQATPRSPATGGSVPTAPIGYGTAVESRRTRPVPTGAFSPRPRRPVAEPTAVPPARPSAGPVRPRVPTTTPPANGSPEESAGTPPVPTRTSPPAPGGSPGGSVGPSASPSGHPSASGPPSPSPRSSSPLPMVLPTPSPTPSPTWSARVFE